MDRSGEFEDDDAAVLEQLETFIANSLLSQGGSFGDWAEHSLTFGCGTDAAMLDRTGFKFAQLAIRIRDTPLCDLRFSDLWPLVAAHSRC